MSSLVNHAWPVTATSKDVYEYFESKVLELELILQQKKIIVFGAGIRGTLLSLILEKNGYNEFYFTDNNRAKWGGGINGHLILPINEVYDDIKNVFVLIAIESCATVERQLEAVGFLAGENYQSLDTTLYDFYIEEFKRKTDGKVLVMGDCGLTHISLLDEKKDNMADLIKRGVGNDSVKVLAMHGMGMCSFYHILKTYVSTNDFPEIMVLMANFDTFTGKQHLLPRSQHVELLERIYDSDVNKQEDFRDYIDEAKKRMNNFQVEIVGGGGKEDFASRARLYIRYNYMYRLREDNENIVYMEKILQWLNKNDVKIIVYIPPVNYQLTEKIGIVNFKEKYEMNVTTINNILKKYKCTLLDFSYLLSENEFSSVMTADETANYEGRCKQANIIVKEIKNIFK